MERVAVEQVAAVIGNGRLVGFCRQNISSMIANAFFERVMAQKVVAIRRMCAYETNRLHVLLVGKCALCCL